MCIISGSVKSVNNTQLFVARSKNGKRQFTVYANTVHTPLRNNMMVLAVPNPTTVKFHDLSSYTDLFKDLENSFPKARSAMLSYSLEAGSTKYEKRIKVEQVGSYNASIVPSVADLKNLDPEYFYVDSKLIDFMEHTYGSYVNIGFVVCGLRQGNHEYHPFAYSHDIHHSNKLFIPTKHYHPTDKMDVLNYGLFGQFDNVAKVPSNGSEKYSNFSDDWDHSIYILNDNVSTVCTRLEGNMRTGYDKTWNVKEDKIDFEFEPVNRLYRMDLKGTHANTDILVI